MSNIIIENSCKIKKKPDPEKVIAKILGKIPDKYKVGIKQINIFYSLKGDSPGIYNDMVELDNLPYSSINIDMSKEDYSGTPFFSILSLNLDFIHAIIKNYKQSTGKSVEKGIEFDWFYLGFWQPLNTIIKINYFLTKKNKLLGYINKIIDKLLLKIAGVPETEKREEQTLKKKE